MREALFLAVVVAFAVWTQVPIWPGGPVLALARGLVGIGFALTAVLLGGEPEQRGNAQLFALCAVLWTVSQLDTRDAGPLPLLAVTVGPLVKVSGAAVLLRYPASRLTRRYRRLVQAGFAVVVIGA